MIPAQIMAIVALLLAFGVDAPTVSTVQNILENKAISAIEVPAPSNSPLLVAPEPTPVLDCSPTLVSEVRKVAGDLTTGTDYLFIGTSTVPVGCTTDLNANNFLSTPSTDLRGKISDWQNSDKVRLVDQGFVFTQGWGTGAGIVPQGRFVWNVSGPTGSSTVVTHVR